MKPITHPIKVETSSFGPVSGEPAENIRFYDTFPHLGYLKGYEDEDLFMVKLSAPNRFFKTNPDIYEIATNAIHGGGQASIKDASELLNISREIDSPANEKPINKVFSTISLLKELVDFLYERDLDTSKDEWIRYYELVDTYMDDLVANIAQDELVDYLQTIYFTMQRMGLKLPPGSYGSLDASWLIYRLENMKNSILERFDVIDYVNDLPETETTPVSFEQAEEDSKNISGLFKNAREHQSYGVKLAYKHKDSNEGSFVFAPADKLLTDLAGSVKKLDDSPDVERTARAFLNFSNTSE